MPDLHLAPNLTIHYLEFNPDGFQAVLLLHGLGATGESWGFQVTALVSAGYRVLAPDTRAFGHSPYPGGKMTVAEMAADMSGLLEALAARPAHVVGISMGGAMALELALNHPQLVRRLVLVNTFACLRPERLRTWFYLAYRLLLLRTRGKSAQAEAVANHLLPRPEQAELRRVLIEQIQQADPRGYRAAMRALWGYDARPRLGQLQMPVLVISGEQDGTVPLGVQTGLAEGIPNARQVVIPDCGHAVIVDNPDLFNRTLLDFLMGE